MRDSTKHKYGKHKGKRYGTDTPIEGKPRVAVCCIPETLLLGFFVAHSRFAAEVTMLAPGAVSHGYLRVCIACCGVS